LEKSSSGSDVYTFCCKSAIASGSVCGGIIDIIVLQGAIHLLAVLEQSSLGNMESCGLVGCLRSSSRGTNPVNYFMDPEDHEDLASAGFELELSRVTYGNFPDE